MKLCFAFLISLQCIACTSETRTDSEILKDVQELVQKNEDYETVHVVVRNNLVILTGQCEGENCSDKLEKEIKEIEGVMAVESDLFEGAELPNH